MTSRSWGVALAIAACSSQPPRASPPVAPAVSETPHEQDHIDALLLHVATARQLTVLHGVPDVVLSRSALIDKLRAHVTRVVPRSEIVGEGLFLRALGVLRPDEDYEQLVYAELDRSMAGMYEPLDQTLYVPGDLSATTLRTSVAHEFAHALADQHFGLAKREAWIAGEGDTMLAQACLAEGDATVTTAEALGTTTSLSDDLTASWVERELVAPYVAGEQFVRALRAHGGWAEVDRAWTQGGLTTEQVLHPDKWRLNEPALVVPIPTIAALGNGATVEWTDVRGELETRLVLSAAMPLEEASQAAAGWGGDEALIARVGDAVAMAWHIRFDDEAHASVAQVAMTSAFGRRACHVSRRSRDLLLLFGAPSKACARWALENDF